MIKCPPGICTICIPMLFVKVLLLTDEQRTELRAMASSSKPTQKLTCKRCLNDGIAVTSAQHYYTTYCTSTKQDALFQKRRSPQQLRSGVNNAPVISKFHWSGIWSLIVNASTNRDRYSLIFCYNRDGSSRSTRADQDLGGRLPGICGLLQICQTTTSASKKKQS